VKVKSKLFFEANWLNPVFSEGVLVGCFYFFSKATSSVAEIKIAVAAVISRGSLISLICPSNIGQFNVEVRAETIEHAEIVNVEISVRMEAIAKRLKANVRWKDLVYMDKFEVWIKGFPNKLTKHFLLQMIFQAFSLPLKDLHSVDCLYKVNSMEPGSEVLDIAGSIIIVASCIHCI